MFHSIYWLVFISGLLSSTILPGNSEAIFSIALIDTPELAIQLLLAVAVGNTIGGMISWGMGRLVAIRYPAEQLTKPAHARALKTIQRWGSPALLLSWVPFIGDPLCIAAGWLKTTPAMSFLYIAIGKMLRYTMLMWLIL
ncbi:MAG: DedA family protein [Gammaproteobacteria bacterium]|nr:DedA family protein [Gammaproteobacteria bacterium]